MDRIELSLPVLETGGLPLTDTPMNFIIIPSSFQFCIKVIQYADSMNSEHEIDKKPVLRTDIELDDLAKNIIWDASKKGKGKNPDFETVRNSMESGTRFKLQLLPLDQAIHRVAVIEEGIVRLKPEIVEELQRLEKERLEKIKKA